MFDSPFCGVVSSRTTEINSGWANVQSVFFGKYSDYQMILKIHLFFSMHVLVIIACYYWQQVRLKGYMTPFLHSQPGHILHREKRICVTYITYLSAIYQV